MNEIEAGNVPAQAVDFIAPARVAGDGAQAASRPPVPGVSHKPQPKRGSVYARTVQEVELGKLPVCATTLSTGALHVLNPDYFVPVSFAAQEWNVTPRRIRYLLSDGRLIGRLQDNGYWEVRYPYSFTFGTRGPVLKRQQKPKRGRPKAELMAA